jgi:hypothetical protein
MSNLLRPPFTKKQLDAMHAKDYDYCWKNFRAEVELALSPPAPLAPLFPRSDIKKIAIAKEMASEYLAFAKKSGHVLPDGTIVGRRA